MTTNTPPRIAPTTAPAMAMIPRMTSGPSYLLVTLQGISDHGVTYGTRSSLVGPKGADMAQVPKAIAEFLSRKRIAVAGVSRTGQQPANAIFRRLRETGHDTIPVNPNASEVEGQHCYPNLESVPGAIDALMVVTHPDVSADLVRQASERGINRIWFHRSFGEGSVSDAALQECDRRGIQPIVGGCPLMFCGNVDVGHRCFRWWLSLRHRIPR